MQTGDAVAIYGAGLSTLLAVAQGGAAWLRRTKVEVTGNLANAPGSSGYGTPISVMHSGRPHDELLFLEIVVRNTGGTPVQVSGVRIEALDPSRTVIHMYQIAPIGALPIVLDPGTSTEIRIEKEHLDFVEVLLFLGIVDGTNRKHGIEPRAAGEFMREIWSLPTRLRVFQDRQDPANRVVAFQTADPAKMSRRPVEHRRWRRSPDVIAARPRPLMQTLLDGDQVFAPSSTPGRESATPPT